MGTVLRHVDVWPFTGPICESWADEHAPPNHPAHDAFLRTMRRVSEAYSPTLIAQRIANVTSEIRLLVCDITDDDAITLSAVADPKPDSSTFEFVDIILPATFAEATGSARAKTGLKVIACSTRSLAQVRGWSTSALEQAEHNTRAGGITCEHATPWKVSPGRRYKARVVMSVHDDGFAWAQLEVAHRQGERIAVSDEQITWANTLQTMRSFKKNVHWSDPVIVTFDEPLGWGSALSITVDPETSTGTTTRTQCDPNPLTSTLERRTQPFPVHVLPPNNRLAHAIP